jgi:hypothetical protein
MRAATFLRVVTVDDVNLLERLRTLLRANSVRFCVINDQAVNAYVKPLVSLDLDAIIAGPDMPRAMALLEPVFQLERFTHSVNLTTAGSDLRVQFQTDPRYAPFVDRAVERDVLGISMPVATVEDVLQGKVWAAQDERRRASKRQKDFADIARLIEAFPHLRERVPETILRRLVQ